MKTAKALNVGVTLLKDTQGMVSWLGARLQKWNTNDPKFDPKSCSFFHENISSYSPSSTASRRAVVGNL